MRNNPDTRDLLFLELEKQAASYNRLRSYQPTSQDVARAYVAASRKPNLFLVPFVALLASIGWMRR